MSLIAYCPCPQDDLTALRPQRRFAPSSLVGQRVHRVRRPAAGAVDRARRRRPRVSRLRPRQGTGRSGDGPERRRPSSARDDGARATLLELVHGLNVDDRVDGILVQSPLPRGDGEGRRAAGLRRDRPGQGRGRLPRRSTPGCSAAGPSGAAAVHAVRCHGAPRPRGRRDRRPARRRDRAERDCRQADGAAAPAARRDGHDLPFADGRPAGGDADGRTFSSPRSAGRDS